MAARPRSEHGTRGRYTRGRCRCHSCREANRDYQRDYMASWNERRRRLEDFYLDVAVELYRRRDTNLKKGDPNE